MLKKNLSKIFFFLFVLIFITNFLYGKEYNVATYNIRTSTAADNPSGNGWANRLSSVTNLILFNNFDIFGTQEVRPNQFKDLNNRLKDVYSSFGVGREDGKNQGEYCAIFYKKNKFKLLDGNTFWISETPDKISKGWDAKYYRICTWVKLQDIESEIEIWFFNVHLDNEGRKARSEGCKLILERIKLLCPANANVVLTGDFNFTQNNKFLNILSECKFLKNTYSSALYKWAPTGTFCGFSPSEISVNTLDYIFVSKSAIVTRYGVLNNIYYTADNKDVTTIDGHCQSRQNKQGLF